MNLKYIQNFYNHYIHKVRYVHTNKYILKSQEVVNIRITILK